MCKHSLEARSPFSYINFEDIAKKTKFIQRHSQKFSAKGFVIAMMKSVIKGFGSYANMAHHLKSSQKQSISRQGLFKRINAKFVHFLKQTAYELLSLQAKPVEIISTKHGINRILT